MPFITGVAGSGTSSYLTDENSNPIMLRGDTVWGLPAMAGAAGGIHTWQADMDNYCSIRAGQGFNAIYIAAVCTTNYTLSQTDVGGDTWDSVNPYVDGDIGVLNDTYWQRIDYLMGAAETLGMTVIMNISASYTIYNAGGPQNGKSAGQWANFGTALGQRYGTAPNLVWAIGDDYFDDQNTLLNGCVDAIKAAETITHLWTYENYPESTSREDMVTQTTKLAGGTRNADFNFVYSYNASYRGIEDAWTESVTTIPVIRGDGYYEVAGGNQAFMRQNLWWCLSSGARGYIYANENTWPWPTTALASMQTYPFSNTDFKAACDAFTGMHGWNQLIPDTGSAMVTAGRGTRIAEITPSGGSGTPYTSGNVYVTASVTADKTLAVIYIPSNVTITVNAAAVNAGYGAKWIDPVTGAATTATPASTYSHAGTNSAGGADWVLTLATPPYATWTVP